MTRSAASGRAAVQAKAAQGATMAGSLLAVLMLVAVAIGLSGCGDDPATRGVTGGLIGAGAGAGIAAVAGGKPATGALIGGGVGALGGALTAPR